jgi:hypothetical protein
MISVSFSFTSDVFIDSKTGLMWQDNSAVKNTKKDWKGALVFCSELRLAGYDDWRLPNIKELQNIEDISQSKSDMKNGFKNVGGSGYYWSASVDESNEEFAWMMNFKRGYRYINYKTYERYIRCVRERK